MESGFCLDLKSNLKNVKISELNRKKNVCGISEFEMRKVLFFQERKEEKKKKPFNFFVSSDCFLSQIRFSERINE